MNDTQARPKSRKSQPQRSPWPLILIVSALLVVATLVAYEPLRHNGFIENYDDTSYITQNAHVRGGLSAQALWWDFAGPFLTPNSAAGAAAFNDLRYIPRSDCCANWHPLTWVSLQLDAMLFGVDMPTAGTPAVAPIPWGPWGFHLTNLVFHVANTLLVFLVFRQMTGALWCSAFVAGLFALHPLHVESVAWAAERKDVLSTFFGLLALAAYTWYARKCAWRVGGWLPTLGRYLLVASLFVLSLMCKPMLVTFPFLLLLLDYWPLGRFARSEKMGTGTASCRASPHFSRTRFEKPGSWIWLIVEKLPLLPLAIASSIVTVFVQRQGGAVKGTDQFPLPDRLGNAGLAYVRYLGKTFWPLDLTIFYPHPVESHLWVTAAAASALLLLMTIAVVALRRQYPFLLVGWLWFVGTLVPVIGLVQVGMQAMADRYTYIPLLGIFVMVAWGTASLVAWVSRPAREARPERGSEGRDKFVKPRPSHPYSGRATPLVLTVVVACGILSVCAWLTRVQVGYWRDPATLWGHAVQATGDSAVAYFNYGLALSSARHPRESVAYFEQALKLRRDYTEALFDLAEAHMQQGNWEEAVHYFRETLKLQPNHFGVRNDCGYALLKLGDVAGASEQFRAVLEINPEIAGAHLNLGTTLEQQGKLEAAAEEYAVATAIDADPPVGFAKNDPKRAFAHMQRGGVFCLLTRYQDAEAEFQSAIQLCPQEPEGYSDLGVAYALQGKLADTFAPFQKAIELQPTAGRYYFYLAHSLAATGRAELARQHYQHGLRLERGWPEQANRAAWLQATTALRGAGRGPMAALVARQLCEATDYQDPDYLDTLAAALARSGQFEEARSTERRALNCIAANGNPDWRRPIEARLRLYETGKCFVASAQSKSKWE